MVGRRTVVVVAAAALAARAAADPAQAKAQFDEGRKLIEAADKLIDPAAKAARVAAACDKFVASFAEDAQLGTKLNLADCRVRQGKLVEAYALLEAAAAEATRTHDRETFATQQLAAIGKQLVKITLHVAQPGTAGTTVRLGGRDVPRADWLKVQVVEPGPIVVDASAPDHQPAHLTHDGPAGAEITIEVPALDATITVAPRPEWVGRSKVPYLVMGGGGVLVLASGVLALHASARYGTAKTAYDLAGVSSAQHEADAATVCVVGGAIAIGLGVWLYVRDKPADRVVSAAVTRDSVGLTVVGRF